MRCKLQSSSLTGSDGARADEDASNGALYVRYMSKIAEKGAAWVDTELTRLQKLASGKLSSTKVCRQFDGLLRLVAQAHSCVF